MKIGDKVRVVYNARFDAHYDRAGIAARREIDGHIAEIIDVYDASGSACLEVPPEFQVSFGDGKWIAWFDRSELTPIVMSKQNVNQVAMGCKPDPSKFKIVDLEHVGNCTIICANYGGLTFGGDKLMVLKGRYNADYFATLDPHFLNAEYPVFARFQPTEEGFRLARLVALAVSPLA